MRRIGPIFACSSLVYLLPLLAPVSSAAQEVTASQVEAQVRASLLAWNTADPSQIIESPGPGGNYGGAGFGYRTKAQRAFQSRAEELEIINRFLAAVEYYRITIDEVESTVDNGVGLAWGFFTEEFQLKGEEPERVSVRFTTVLRRDASGWHQIMFHRDAQPFDDNGSYIRRAGP